MEEIWIKTTRGPVYGRAAGESGRPLILGLHGWSQRNGWHTWEPLLEPLGAAGFRAVSIDMPGWGQSPAWETTPGPAALGVILDGLNSDAWALMGKSWGGGLAIDFALSYPERVARLVLTAPAFRGTLADLERLTQPVLMAWAQDDPVIPIDHGAAMAEAIPSCEFIRYDSGGHSAAPNNAADFAPRAVAFLKMKANS